MADAGGYAFTADDTPDVIVRMRGAHDDATPNANAIMLSNLVALHLLTGKQAYLDRANAIPQAFAADLGRNTLGHCGLLAGFFDLHRAAARGGDRAAAPEPPPQRSPAPCSAVAAGRRPAGRRRRGRRSPAPPSPARPPSAAKPTAYACIGPQCSLPVTERAR